MEKRKSYISEATWEFYKKRQEARSNGSDQLEKWAQDEFRQRLKKDTDKHRKQMLEQCKWVDVKR